MGLTYTQAKACGLEHLWPKGGEAKALPDAPSPPSRFQPDGMNKTERHFWQRAREAYGDDVYREPFKLRLAGRTWYTIDFLICTEGCRYDCYEVKGYLRDDAAVKLKVAADLYPCLNFVMVTREKQVWLCRCVTRNGIDFRNTWTPHWLL